MAHEAPIGKAARTAVAFSILTAADRYRSVAEEFAAGYASPQLRSWLEVEIEALRRYCADFPELSPAMTELLIAHADLVHERWRIDHGARGDLRQTHVRLRDACAWLHASTKRLIQAGD